MAKNNLVSAILDCGVIGVDPGQNGGMAFMRIDETEACAAVLPLRYYPNDDKPYLDGFMFREWIVTRLAGCRQIIGAYVEKVHAMPKQGVVSTASFMRNYGQILGVIQTLKILLQFARPVDWQKAVLGGTTGGKKTLAVQFCDETHPDVNLLATPRCRKKHDGMADAMCICEYGRRQLLKLAEEEHESGILLPDLSNRP